MIKFQQFDEKQAKELALDKAFEILAKVDELSHKYNIDTNDIEDLIIDVTDLLQEGKIHE